MSNRPFFPIIRIQTENQAPPEQHQSDIHIQELRFTHLWSLSFSMRSSKCVHILLRPPTAASHHVTIKYTNICISMDQYSNRHPKEIPNKKYMSKFTFHVSSVSQTYILPYSSEFMRQDRNLVQLNPQWTENLEILSPSSLIPDGCAFHSHIDKPRNDDWDLCDLRQPSIHSQRNLRESFGNDSHWWQYLLEIGFAAINRHSIPHGRLLLAIVISVIRRTCNLSFVVSQIYPATAIAGGPRIL